MQTLKGTLTIDFKAVVPQQLLDDMRSAAGRSDATPFLIATHAKHPVNDDAFVAAILKNAVRHSTRDNLLALFAEAGVGGTVSPATIDVIELPEDFGGSVEPQTVEVEFNQAAFYAPALVELLPVGLIGDEA